MSYFDKSFTLVVDTLLPPPSESYDSIEFNQTDSGTCFLNIYLRKLGKRLDLTGASVSVAFERPDGTFVEQDLTTGVSITDAPSGQISVELGPQVLSQIGKTIGQVEVTYPSGKIITTKTFFFSVASSLFQNITGPGTTPSDVLYLHTSSVATDSVTLVWTASSAATSYNIYQNSVLIGNTNSASYGITGLSPSTSYFFKVIALNSAGSAPGTGSGCTVTVTTPANTTAVVGSATVGTATVA